MVDAKGRIIRANKKQNSDLLWATRGGGGGNFGVYTKYKFKVRRSPAKATVFSITWPWDQFEKVVKKWQVWAPKASTKLGSELSVGPKKGGNVSMLGVYLGSKSEALRQLEPILSVGTPTKKAFCTCHTGQPRSFCWPRILCSPKNTATSFPVASADARSRIKPSKSCVSFWKMQREVHQPVSISLTGVVL